MSDTLRVYGNAETIRRLRPDLYPTLHQQPYSNFAPIAPLVEIAWRRRAGRVLARWRETIGGAR